MVQCLVTELDVGSKTRLIAPAATTGIRTRTLDLAFQYESRDTNRNSSGVAERKPKNSR
jgi:hypothetical protein